MKKLNRVQVLNALNPYFRVLKAYNSENIWPDLGSFNAHNICFAVIVGIFTAFIPIASVLAIWHVIYDDVAMRKVFVDVSVIITAIQTFVTICALTINNRKIGKMIILLQDTISQRKCLLFIFMAFTIARQHSKNYNFIRREKSIFLSKGCIK